jgi:hypothetical protein
VSGAQWCDFVSFDDRFPEPLQLFIVRITRAQVDIPAYEAKVKTFLADVDRDVAAVMTPRPSFVEQLEASLAVR